MAELSAQELEVAKLLVSAVNLKLSPNEIDPEQPLFGDQGLGLDSIDALELALAISQAYGFQLRSDDANNKQIFSSLRALARYVQENRGH